MRLSLFTKNFLKICAPNSSLLCRNAKWIVLFIHLAKRHRTDFSQPLYSSGKKTWSTKILYLLYSNSWALVRTQRSCLLPKVWALMEMRGRNDRIGLPCWVLAGSKVGYKQTDPSLDRKTDAGLEL